jgi:hypothetical protein
LALLPEGGEQDKIRRRRRRRGEEEEEKEGMGEFDQTEFK